MTQLNFENTNKLLNEIARVLIEWNPDATYNSSTCGTDMEDFVRLAIQHNGLSRAQHLQDLLLFRQNFEKAIAKRYRVKFTYQLNEDLAVKYRKKKVPQVIQVKSGVLDLLIGELNTTRINVNSLFNQTQTA